jgi:hypothetical protein
MKYISLKRKGLSQKGGMALFVKVISSTMLHFNFNGKTLTTTVTKDTTEKKAKGKAASSELSDRFLRRKLPNLTLSS